MKNWDNNDKGQVTVNYGGLTAYCYTDSPYYFKAVLAKLAYWDKETGKAVFTDGSNYATSRRSFTSEAQIRRLAQG
jgi:hypothetical protein